MVVLATTLGLMLAACDGDAPAASAPGGESVDAPPLLSLPTPEGDVITVERGSGKGVLVLAFWKTTCDPCRGQLDEFDSLQRELGDSGLRVVAVNVDGPKTGAMVQGFLTRGDYSFEVVLDQDTEAMTRYNPRGECPFYIVLSEDGSELQSHGGYSAGEIEQQLGEYLRTRLAQN